MRHADFLILTKEYKLLEKEANEMAKLDKVNPRILRYLGYSAYENGNNDEAIKALSDFLATPNVKIIGRDYLYLGFAKAKKATVSKAGISTVENALFNSGVADIKKGVEMDPVMANELNDFGKKFFDLKLYKEAAAVYEVAVSNTNSRNYLYDAYYLGYSLYFDNANKPAGQKVDVVALQKANAAFSIVIEKSPTFQDAYIYKARVNSLIENDALAQEEMVKNYQQYIKVVTEKGATEMAKPAIKTKFVEAYNNIAIHYVKTDKVKARENFLKVLEIDPTNETATSTLKTLK
jgi:tetratricopeptide (TPR) repeat protein